MPLATHFGQCAGTHDHGGHARGVALLAKPRQARSAIKDIVEMPDAQIDRVIRSVQANQGQLSNLLRDEIPLLADTRVWGARGGLGVITNTNPLTTDKNCDNLKLCIRSFKPTKTSFANLRCSRWMRICYYQNNVKWSTLMQVAIDLPNDLVAFQGAASVGVEVRQSYALWLFLQERVTLAKAAEVAGLSLYQFMELCKANRTPVIDTSRQELETELAGFKAA
jgi:predicted HTH domain antitoxin